MKKPTMKRETGILVVLPELNSMRIHSTLDNSEGLCEFGRVTRQENGEFWLEVDARFDFLEVVSYLAERFNQGVEWIRVWLPSCGYFGLDCSLKRYKEMFEEGAGEKEG